MPATRHSLTKWTAALRGGIFLAFLALGCWPAAAQRPAQERDLRIVPESDAPRQQDPLAAPRSYALVIGVAAYPNLPENKQLKYTERDAEKIYSILISPRGGNFRAENVRKLVGPQATLANIRDALENWLPSVAQGGDRVLVYFAGHGFVYQGRAYLAPQDIDPLRIEQTGYPMDQLGRVMGGKIQARHKVLLTDSCHSGAIRPEANPDENQIVSRSLLSLDTSLFSLTASRDREQSFESSDWGGGHGIFTYYVVKGLEGEADKNMDGIVTADELAEYTRRNVREATNDRQTPTSDQGSFDPNMPLAYIPDVLAERRPQRAAAQEGTLVFESNVNGVEIFIDGQSAGVVNKDAPLRVPGLRPGPHEVKGVRMGYEPDGPREEVVYPGQEKTVTIKILYPRRRNKAALGELRKGIEYYNKGFAKNYERAAAHFEKALSLDPNYSEAALYLGRVYSALFAYDEATAAYRKAVEIDPDYLDARSSFGGMLLDVGDFDEAIRQLTFVVQRDPSHALAHAMLAQAYRMKEMYPESVEAARKAIALDGQAADPHFFLADSLRLSGKVEEAIPEYEAYLRLSDFESSTGERIANYWIRGFLIGGGKKRRATQKDIWNDLRSLAYFGLGDCERLLERPDPAIEFYTKALSFDQEDPKVHWALGLALTQKAEMTGKLDTLPLARDHFQTVLKINDQLIEAERARKYIAKIDDLLAQAPGAR